MSNPAEKTITTKAEATNSHSSDSTAVDSAASKEVVLFMGNLPYTMADSDLESLFSAEGITPKKVFIKYDRDGNSKGFGFVHLATNAEADNAIEKLNRKQIGRMRLRVNIADPDSPHLNRRAEGSGEYQQRRPAYREREYTAREYTAHDNVREYTARDFSPREYTARDTVREYTAHDNVREYTARDFSPREYTARDTARADSGRESTGYVPRSYAQNAYQSEREYRAPYREYRAPRFQREDHAPVRREHTIDIE
jgi:RNA recognition motif-containing protein